MSNSLTQDADILKTVETIETVETPKTPLKRGRRVGFRPKPKLNKKTDAPRYFADKMAIHREQKKKVTYNCIEIAGVKYLWKNKIKITKINITKINGKFLIID